MRLGSVREIRKMRGLFVEVKENIDDFCQNHTATATDLYRAEFNAELARKELDKLLRLKKEVSRKRKKSGKERNRLHNNVELQKGIFLMTYQTLQEQLDALTLKTDIQIMISQKLFDLRDKARKIIGE